MINLGGIGRAIKRVVSAPFKVVGKVLGVGGSPTVKVSAPKVSAPKVSAAQVVPSTEAAAPEAPVLGTENTTQDTRKRRKKKGKSRLLINNDSQSSNSSGYSGLNI